MRPKTISGELQFYRLCRTFDIVYDVMVIIKLLV